MLTVQQQIGTQLQLLSRTNIYFNRLGGALKIVSTCLYSTVLEANWAVALGYWLAPLPFTLEFGVRFPVSAV